MKKGDRELKRLTWLVNYGARDGSSSCGITKGWALTGRNQLDNWNADVCPQEMKLEVIFLNVIRSL